MVNLARAQTKPWLEYLNNFKTLSKQDQKSLTRIVRLRLALIFLQTY